MLKPLALPRPGDYPAESQLLAGMVLESRKARNTPVILSPPDACDVREPAVMAFVHDLGNVEDCAPLLRSPAHPGCNVLNSPDRERLHPPEETEDGATVTRLEAASLDHQWVASCWSVVWGIID